MKKLLLTIGCISSFAFTQAQMIVSVEEPAVIAGGYNFSYSNNGWNFPDMNLVQNAITGSLIVADDGTASDSLGCNTWTIPAGGIVNGLTPIGAGTGYSDAFGVATTTNGSGTGLTVDIVTAAAGQIISLDELSLVAGSGYVSAMDVATTTNGSGTGLTVDIIATTSGPANDLDNGSLEAGAGYVSGNGISTTGGAGTGLTVDIVAEEIGEVSALDLGTLVAGEGYVTGNDIATTSANGSGLTVDITAEVIGEVENATLENAGTEYESATDVVVTGGNGTGLTVDITADPIGSVTGLDLLFPGSNYTDGPAAIAGGTGSGLVISLLTDGVTGEIVSVTILDGGIDYEANDVVNISGGDGSAVVQILSVTNGEVTSFSINQGGMDYEVGDLVTIDGGNNDATIEITAVKNGEVLSVAIADGGMNYVVGDVITITGGTIDATIEVLEVTDGKVLSVAIADAGEDYEVGDVITIDGGTTSATIEISAVLAGEISSITIVEGGVDYEVGDLITIDGGDGNATIEVLEVTDGSIESITIVNGGKGYAAGNTVTIAGGNGDATFEVASTTGHIALIYRGSCEFGMKALRAQQAGAIGVVIVNNVPGLIPMGGGAQGSNVTIPAVMISMEDGATIRELVDAGEDVVMFIGSKTGLYANDLGMLGRHPLKAKATATPITLAQNASEFSVQTGTWVTNYGFEDQTNITVSAEITFGANQVYFNESAPFDLVAGDSVYVALGTFSQASYSIGQYTLTYTVALDGLTDDYPGDNKNVSTFSITENTFGIAELDENGMPKQASGIRASSATSSFSGCVVVDNPNASRLAPTGITFAASTLSTSEVTLPDAGVFTIEAIEWNDAFTDLNDPNLNLSDIQVRAGGEFTFDADDQGVFVFAPFTNSFVMQNNKRYMFCITTLNENVYLAFDSQSNYLQNEEEFAQPIMTINADGTYSLGFTTPAYPSMLVHFAPAAAVGIEETNEVSVTPFPNPAQDYITVPMTGFNGEATLTITDMYGKVISVQRMNTNAGSALQVNVQDLSNGMYSFRLVDEKGTNSVFNVMVTK
jgi:hypothetical protein